MVYRALGTRLFERCWAGVGPQHAAKKELFYKVLVFLLTYMTYVGYHMAKRPITVVENSLKFLDCSNTTEEDPDQKDLEGSLRYPLARGVSISA